MGAGRAEVAPEGPTSVCGAPWVRGPRDSLVPACRCQSVTGLDFGGSLLTLRSKARESSDEVAGLPDAWSERGLRLGRHREIQI